MPTLRKLTQDEARALNTKPLGERARAAAQYDAYLQDFVPGDYGEVQLDENDNRLTVRNRLQAAASRRGLALTFRRTTGPLLWFRVEAVSGAQGRSEAAPPAAVAEVPESEPATATSQEVPPADAPKRRGRRPQVESQEIPVEGTPKRRGRRPRAETVQATPVVEEKPRRGRKPRSAST